MNETDTNKQDIGPLCLYLQHCQSMNGRQFSGLLEQLLPARPHIKAHQRAFMELLPCVARLTLNNPHADQAFVSFRLCRARQANNPAPTSKNKQNHETFVFSGRRMYTLASTMSGFIHQISRSTFNFQIETRRLNIGVNISTSDCIFQISYVRIIIKHPHARCHIASSNFQIQLHNPTLRYQVQISNIILQVSDSKCQLQNSDSSFQTSILRPVYQKPAAEFKLPD